MRYAVRKLISNKDRAKVSKAKTIAISNRVKDIIDRKEVHYSKELGVHYVIVDVYTFEDPKEEVLEVRIEIETLEDVDTKHLLKCGEEIFNSMGDKVCQE